MHKMNMYLSLSAPVLHARNEHVHVALHCSTHPRCHPLLRSGARQVSFGNPYPDMINPLDNTPKILHQGSGYFQYHIKVVPTVYQPLWGSSVNTNQYSYTELFRTTQDIDKLPAVYFHYELSPIMAKVIESRKSYTSFLTSLCAVVGGVFTVAGMVDSMLHRINRMVEK